MSGLGALQRFARPGARARAREPGCELCALPLPEPHAHLVDVEQQALACVCQACALLFPRGELSGRYRAIPNQPRFDPVHRLDEASLRALGVPVGLCFLFRQSRLARWSAFYPSPLGATEAEIEVEAWEALVAGNALLRSAADDVEAVLLRHQGVVGLACFVVPIDLCYRLTGLVRRNFRGFDGGAELRAAVADFFEELAACSRAIETGAAAAPRAQELR